MSDGPPILPPLALDHLERALKGAAEVKAGLARAAEVCQTAAENGAAPRDACVFLDFILAAVGDMTDQVARLRDLSRDAILDRRKEPRNYG